MPIAKVQLEDGRIARFEVPEGTTPEQVMAFAQSQFGGQGAAQQPERAPAQREARAFGIGVRDVAQGLMALPGAVYNPIAAAGRAVGLPIRNLDQNIDLAADAAGLPRAETKGERITSGIIRGGASALPTVGAGLAMQGGTGAAQRIGQMLAANPGTQVVASATGGGAQSAAEETGAGPVGQFAAGVAGGAVGVLGMEGAKGAGRMALAAMEPFSAQGPDRIAGRTLYQSSASPETVQARIAEGVADQSRRVPGAPVTTAQAARDPGLAIIESGLRNDPTGGATSPAVALRNIEFARNQARLDAMGRAAPMPLGQAPEALGAPVRSALKSSQDAARAGVRQAFQAIEADGPAQIPTAEIARRVGFAAHDTYGAGSGGMPKQLADVLDDFQRFGDLGGMSNRDGVSTVQFLQNIRSRLGNVAGMASRGGDNQLASAAGSARQALDAAVEDFATSGRGVAPEQLGAWRDAIAKRREMGATFGRSGEGAPAVQNILNRDQYGRPMMPDDKVTDAAIASAGNVRQVLKAAGQNAQQVQQALQTRFMDKFMSAAQTRTDILDASGNRATPVSAAQAKTFWKQNENTARALFPPDQFAQLRRLMGDFAETSATQGVAASRGSPTAQNLMVGNMIARSTGGLVDPSSPAAQTLVGLGPTMRLLYSAPETATRDALARALVDPQEAMRLMQLAGPQGASQASGYVNSQMRERLVQALMGELARGGARTANALAIQGQTGP
jgi:hypothetical protein